MKATVKGEFFEVEVEGTTEQELWERMAFWHSLPTVCPIDGMPVRFGYSKNDDGNDFHYLESTGPIPWQFQFGTRKEDKKLYPGKMDKDSGKAVQRWAYWDRETNQRIVGWEDGKLVGQQPRAHEDNAARLAHVERTRQQQQAVGRYPSPPEAEAGVANGAAPVTPIQPDSIEALRIEFEALGFKLYGPGWPRTKVHNIKKVSGNRTDSAEKLTLDEISRLVAGMRHVDETKNKETA